MVQVKFSIDTAFRRFARGSKVTIIDEAESTPGDSRQITEFREKELPKLEEWLRTYDGEVTDAVSHVHRLGNFRLAAVAGDLVKGCAVMSYDYETEGA